MSTVSLIQTVDLMEKGEFVLEFKTICVLKIERVRGLRFITAEEGQLCFSQLDICCVYVKTP